MKQFLLVILPIIFVSGCNKLYPVDVGVSQGKGVVRRVDYVHHMITLDHEKIPNLLQAMTFAYPVQYDSMMDGLLPQDTVSFVLNEPKPGQFLVQSVKKIGSPKKRTVPVLLGPGTTTTSVKTTVKPSSKLPRK